MRINLFAFKYDSIPELNENLKTIKAINPTDLFFLNLEYLKSKKGRIIFVNINHRKVFLKKIREYFILSVLIVFFSFSASLLNFDSLSINLKSLIKAFITLGYWSPFIFFIKLIRLSKEIIFSKNTISGHKFSADFDEILIQKNDENINYALFKKNNSTISKGICLVADNENQTKTLVDFLNNFANKAEKKILNQIE